MARVGGVGLLGVLAFSALVGCSKPSCDHRASGLYTCEDQLKGGDTFDYDCTMNPDPTKRGTLSKKACDRTGAIGACETSYNRVWYYPGGRASKIEQVASLCPADGYPIGVDGKKVSVTPEKVADALLDPGLVAIGTPYKAQLDANVAAIEKIKPGGPASGTVRLTGGKHVLAGPATAVAWERDVTRFEDASPAPSGTHYDSPNANDLHLCGLGWGKHNRMGVGEDVFKKVFPWCAGVTTLIVLTTTELVRPVKERDKKEFTTGKVKGTAYVYELPSGKLAGGYPFAAENNDVTKSNTLDIDFVGNMNKALTTGLAKADPGATYTFALGSL